MTGKRDQTVIISILADTKKMSRAFKNLSNELGLTKLGSGFKALGRQIVDVFKTGVKWASALGAAVVGMAVTGGIKRALAVEDATFLMKQLGMQVEDIDRAIAAVDKTFDGTPFANPDGFNFSAQLSASGKALEQVERDLRITSNVTAMTLDKDFGRISEMFLKMSANGRVTATDLNSIGLSGYPIRQVLADALNVSVEGLNKMVSSGELTYDKLMDVLDGVENLDGAAKNLGDNTKVSFSNMLTSFSSVGEKFVTKLLPTFRDGFQAIRERVRLLGPAAAEAGEKLATWLGETAVPAVQRLAAWITDTLLPALVDAKDLIGGAFTTAIDTVRAALDDAGFSAEGLGSSIGGTIVNAVRIMANVIATGATVIANIIAFFIKWKDVLIPLAVYITGMVVAWQAYAKVMAIVRAAQAALNVAMAANPIGLVVMAIGALVASFIYLWNTSDDFRTFWISCWTGIKAAFDTAITWISNAIEWFGTLGDKFGTWFDNARTAAVVKLIALVTWITGLPDRAVTALASLGVRLATSARTHVDRFRTAAIEKFAALVTWITGLPGRMLSSLGNTGRILWNAGAAIISGLWNGLKQKWQDVKNWFGGIGDWIASNKGPKEYDLKLLVPAGKWIMQGLQHGLESEISNLKRTLTDVTGVITGTAMPEIDVPAVTGDPRAATHYTDNREISIRVDAANIRELQDIVRLLEGTEHEWQVVS